MANLNLQIVGNLGDVEGRIKKLTTPKTMTLHIKVIGDGKNGNGSLKNIKNQYEKILDVQKKCFNAQKQYTNLFTGKNKDKIVESSSDKQRLQTLKQYSAELDALASKAQAGKLTKAEQSRFKTLSANANKVVKEVDTSRARIENSLAKMKNVDSAKIGYDKIGSRLTDYFNRYETQLTKNIGLYNKWQTLMNKANTGKFASVAQANREFAAFRTQARAAGIEMESFGTKLQKTFGTRMRSALSGYGVYALQTALRDIVRNAIEVDTAMTELKKVTSETDATYTRFLENAETRAQSLGATLSEVVNATADYARLGYDINEATTLADSALIYSNVGDDVNSIDDATAALISTMQGFNISAEDSMSIVDKFNNVSNNYASSAGDIGEIVKRSAASMSAAGNTLDQTISLGVAANEVQQDADTVGTALKTMSMRLRGSKTDLEAAGLDTEGMASSVSTLRDEIMSLAGVDIMLNDDTFKSSYDILMGIGEVWDSLSDVNRANITELLFGKRQANIGSAILQNYERAQEIYETSLNSDGSAISENEKYLESIQGHIDKFQAKWESFSTNIADSTGLKQLIDLGGAIISIFDKMTDTFGAAGMALLPFVSMFSKIGNTGKLKYALLQRAETSCRMIAA